MTAQPTNATQHTDANAHPHNTLGGGVIGHILRNRSTNSSTYAATDRWFHYDQVGSVMAETDSAGTLAQTHHQDAFGNTQASWSTGLWGGDKPGWRHNTKEYDADIGLVYMYMRWYNGETGTFASRAPMAEFLEHPYSFAEGTPIQMSDATGESPCDFIIPAENGITGFSSGALHVLSFGAVPLLHDPTNPDQNFGSTTGQVTGATIQMVGGAAASGRAVGIGMQAGRHRLEKKLLGKAAARASSTPGAYGLPSAMGRLGGGYIPTRAALGGAVGMSAGGGAMLGNGAHMMPPVPLPASPPAIGGRRIGTGATGYWGRKLGC